ncbi:MAG: transcription antitermination factor NusB [Microgenomates group bacterium]
MDIRHQRRIKIVQQLYAYSFFSQQPIDKFHLKTKKIIEKKDQLNSQIEKFAPRFPLKKIARVDLAILQLAIYELTIEKKEPPKVIINEAVELAKELGSERSYAFINAVLGKIYESIS